MPTDNILNTAKGRLFQRQVAKTASHHFGVEFQLDYPIQIGNPPKEHRFDLVSVDSHYIGECKSYSWTESGNVPSAKMGFVNEAVFYLSFLSPSMVRFIAMRKDLHPMRRETVADFYYRTYRHLLNGVLIIEVDVESGTLRKIG
jgi:hypothetical protein